MSLGLTHFAVGAALTALVLAFGFPSIRYRQTWIIIGGLWALVPDLHYISPVYQAPLKQIKATVLGDVFWFHRTMDALEQGRGSRVVAGIAVGFLLVTIAATEFYLDEWDRP